MIIWFKGRIFFPNKIGGSNNLNGWQPMVYKINSILILRCVLTNYYTIVIHKFKHSIVQYFDRLLNNY